MRFDAKQYSQRRIAACAWTLGVAAVVAIAPLVTGCRTASVSEPVSAKFGANDPDAQIEFWHELGARPVTCNDDAFHGLLIYLDGEDQSNGYPARVDTLKSRGLLPASFDAPPTRAVSRGTLGFAIVRALQIKGGVMMRATNGAPRYAVRELIYEGVYPLSSPHQTFSGAEFLGVMGKMEDWQRVQRGDAVEVPAAVLPGDSPVDAPGDAAGDAGRGGE